MACRPSLSGEAGTRFSCRCVFQPGSVGSKHSGPGRAGGETAGGGTDGRWAEQQCGAITEPLASRQKMAPAHGNGSEAASAGWEPPQAPGWDHASEERTGSAKMNVGVGSALGSWGRSPLSREEPVDGSPPDQESVDYHRSDGSACCRHRWVPVETPVPGEVIGTGEAGPGGSRKEPHPPLSRGAVGVSGAGPCPPGQADPTQRA